MPHVQRDHISSFNQSEHCFVGSSLPSSLFKLSTNCSLQLHCCCTFFLLFFLVVLFFFSWGLSWKRQLKDNKFELAFAVCLERPSDKFFWKISVTSVSASGLLGNHRDADNLTIRTGSRKFVGWTPSLEHSDFFRASPSNWMSPSHKKRELKKEMFLRHRSLRELEVNIPHARTVVSATSSNESCLLAKRFLTMYMW